MADLREINGLSRSSVSERFAQPRVGIVTSSDSRTATARVLMQPEGILTGWLPVLTHAAGAGWGIFCPPGPGDQVLIIAQEGDSGHGVIAGCLFSNSVPPPRVEVGEIAICHSSGSSLRLMNSGRIEVTGDLFVSGEVHDRHGPLSRLRAIFNGHTHRSINSTVTSSPLTSD
jgi:phage baseplate assembly protein gpV